MKYSRRVFGSVMMSFACFAATQGQIQITQAQVQAIFSTGNTIRLSQDTMSQTVNVGRKGGPNTYDFRSLPFMFVGRETVFNVSQIPRLAPRYPANTVSVKVNAGTDAYSYLNIMFASQQLQSVGEAFVSKSSGLFENYRHYTPAEVEANFPATYNTQIMQTFTSRESLYFNGTLFSSSSTTLTENTFVDGYGTVLLPGGLSLSCLRSRKIETVNGTYQGFSYYTREGAVLIVDSRNTQPDTGIVQSGGVTLLLGGPLSDVTQSEPLPTGFSLLQNYPNPFNPSTKIRFNIPRSTVMTLKVYNLLGQEIETIASGEWTPGEYTVGWTPQGLASGVYIYRLQAGDFTESRKLLFIK